MTIHQNSDFIRVASLAEVQELGCKVVQTHGKNISIFYSENQVYALDNRCPHMGFPLDQGTCKNGILTCHWHHARFEMVSGGTFDLWADDVDSFAVEIKGDEIWLNPIPKVNKRDYLMTRLQDGLERNDRLVIGKSIIGQFDLKIDPKIPFKIGLEFGAKYHQAGWGVGLTILTCMMNLLPYISPDDQPRALYQGLSAISSELENQPPRFLIKPLPTTEVTFSNIKKWFRQFIEVRDREGAERCIVTAIRAGFSNEQLAIILFTAATDYRYLDIGHVVDFTNKAFEALDKIGWDSAELILSSLVRSFTRADRMDENNDWRHPVDLIQLLNKNFPKLYDLEKQIDQADQPYKDRQQLIDMLLNGTPDAIIDNLLHALQEKCSLEELAQIVTLAAALRIARFPVSNEFTDWDTALHTFTYANAVYQGIKRINSIDVARGIFDAAMSIYLDRFLNVPATRLPEAKDTTMHPEEILTELSNLLNKQQQVNEAGKLVATYFHVKGDVKLLLSKITNLLLREDRDFHTIQTVEAVFNLYQTLGDTKAGEHVIIAAVRYLAAHSPTMRSQGQTYKFAQRLSRGEKIFEESSPSVSLHRIR